MAHSCSACAALQSAALPHQTLAYECWSDSQINSIALFCLVIIRRELSGRKECWPWDGVRNMNRHVYWKKCAFRKFSSIDKCVKASRNVFLQKQKRIFLSIYIKLSCFAEQDPANRLNILSCYHCRHMKSPFLQGKKKKKTCFNYSNAHFKITSWANSKGHFHKNLILRFYKMRQLHSQWERSRKSRELMTHR